MFRVTHRAWIAALALVSAVPAAACAQSWHGPFYPKKANSPSPSLAVSASGAATVLFPGPRQSVSTITRASATGKWSTAAGMWLDGAKAGGNRHVAAAYAGTQLGALWTVGRSGRALRAARGTGLRATTTARRRTLPAALTGIDLITATGSGLAADLASTTDAMGSRFAAGALPTSAPARTSTLPSGVKIINSSVDGTGTTTAMVSLGGGALGLVTRPAGGAWGTVQPVPGTATAGRAGMPTTLSVDSVGDAAVAYATTANPATGALSLSGTQHVIAVSERIGTTGTLSEPFVVRGAADGTGAQFDGSTGTVAISPGAVVVGGTGPPLGTRDLPQIALIVASAAPGQAFPLPSGINVTGSTENWYTQGLTSAATVSGMGVVAVWGAGAQGDVEDLGVTTSTGPGQPWSAEKNLAGVNTTESGYTGVSVQAFGNGFVAAWSASLTNDAVYPTPSYPIGVATFQ